VCLAVCVFACVCVYAPTATPKGIGLDCNYNGLSFSGEFLHTNTALVVFFLQPAD